MTTLSNSMEIYNYQYIVCVNLKTWQPFLNQSSKNYCDFKILYGNWLVIYY